MFFRVKERDGGRYVYASSRKFFQPSRQSWRLCYVDKNGGDLVGKSGGKMDQVSPQKLSPGYRFFGGKTDIQLEYTHCKDYGRPTFRVAGGRPATPHGRPAKGQNGQKDFLVGHHKLVSSQVPSTQPCGSKLSTVKQERE